VLQHEILDWLLANHDSHAGQFLSHEGELIAIDKGQAWKWIGEDTFHPGFKGQNPSDPIYKKFWEQVKSGKISSEGFVEAALEVIERWRQIPVEQFRSIVAPYVVTLAGGTHKEPEEIAKKLEARFLSLAKDVEGFLSGQLGQVVSFGGVQPIEPTTETLPSPLKLAPSPKEPELPIQAIPKPPLAGPLSVAIEPSSALSVASQWPITKGNEKGKVTVTSPGVKPPASWPAGIPGAGFMQDIVYKKEAYKLSIFEKGGKVSFLIQYPDGTSNTWPSINQAGDSLYLYANKLPISMGAKDKKEKGISLGSKVFRFEQFKAELEAAYGMPSVAVESPPSKAKSIKPLAESITVQTPKELEQANIIEPGQKNLPFYEVAEKLPAWEEVDPSVMPPEVQELIDQMDASITSYPDVWDAAIFPGKVVKILLNTTGKPGFLIGDVKQGKPVYHIYKQDPQGNYTIGSPMNAEIYDTGFDLYSKLGSKGLEEEPYDPLKVLMEGPKAGKEKPSEDNFETMPEKEAQPIQFSGKTANEHMKVAVALPAGTIITLTPAKWPDVPTVNFVKNEKGSWHPFDTATQAPLEKEIFSSNMIGVIVNSMLKNGGLVVHSMGAIKKPAPSNFETMPESVYQPKAGVPKLADIESAEEGAEIKLQTEGQDAPTVFTKTQGEWWVLNPGANKHEKVTFSEVFLADVLDTASQNSNITVKGMSLGQEKKPAPDNFETMPEGLPTEFKPNKWKNSQKIVNALLLAPLDTKLETSKYIATLVPTLGGGNVWYIKYKDAAYGEDVTSSHSSMAWDISILKEPMKVILPEKVEELPELKTMEEKQNFWKDQPWGGTLEVWSVNPSGDLFSYAPLGTAIAAPKPGDASGMALTIWHKGKGDHWYTIGYAISSQALSTLLQPIVKAKKKALILKGAPAIAGLIKDWPNIQNITQDIPIKNPSKIFPGFLSVAPLGARLTSYKLSTGGKVESQMFVKEDGENWKNIFTQDIINNYFVTQLMNTQDEVFIYLGGIPGSTPKPTIKKLVPKLVHAKDAIKMHEAIKASGGTLKIKPNSTDSTVAYVCLDNVIEGDAAKILNSALLELNLSQHVLNFQQYPKTNKFGAFVAIPFSHLENPVEIQVEEGEQVPSEPPDQVEEKPQKKKPKKLSKKEIQKMAAAKQKIEEQKVWAIAHPTVKDPETFLLLAHFQKHMDKWFSESPWYARVENEGETIFLQPKSFPEDFPAVMKKQFPLAEQVETIHGPMMRVSLQSLRDRYPEALPVKGPDGKLYPVGTTFQTEKTSVTVGDLLKTEPGFHSMVPHTSMPDYMVLKVAGTGASQKEQLHAIVQKFGLHPLFTEPKQTSSSWMHYFLKKEIDNSWKEEEKLVVLPGESPSPLRLAPLPSGTTTTEHWGEVGDNRAELGLLEAVKIPLYGHVIRIGKPGILTDFQVNIRKVKTLSGDLVYEVTGDLLEFKAQSSKLNPTSSIPLTSAASQLFAPLGKLKTIEYDAETGVHDESKSPGEIMSLSGFQGTVRDGKTVVQVIQDPSQQTMNGTFKVRIPVGDNVEEALGEAFEAMGYNAAEALSPIDEKSDRIFKKWSILRSTLGPLAFGQSDAAIPRKQRHDEKYLDTQLDKLGVQKLVPTAKVQRIFQSKVTVTVAGEEHFKEHWSCPYVGTKFPSVIIQLAQGAGWASRKERYLKGVDTDGKSKGEDFQTGGAAGVFCRIAGSQAKINPAYAYNVVFHPRLFRRTDWYHYNDDHFGVIAPNTFNTMGPQKGRLSAGPITSVGNEIIFQGGMDIRDIVGIMCTSPESATSLKEKLISMGITEINGASLDAAIKYIPPYETTGSKFLKVFHIKEDPEEA
jgi:hypothetical protein